MHTYIPFSSLSLRCQHDVQCHSFLCKCHVPFRLHLVPNIPFFFASCHAFPLPSKRKRAWGIFEWRPFLHKTDWPNFKRSFSFLLFLFLTTSDKFSFSHQLSILPSIFKSESRARSYPVQHIPSVNFLRPCASLRSHTKKLSLCFFVNKSILLPFTCKAFSSTLIHNGCRR